MKTIKWERRGSSTLKKTLNSNNRDSCLLARCTHADIYYQSLVESSGRASRRTTSNRPRCPYRPARRCARASIRPRGSRRRTRSSRPLRTRLARALLYTRTLCLRSSSPKRPMLHSRHL